MADDYPDDAALVRRSRLGDDAAFGELYLRYQRRLRRASRAAGADAEDVVQETFLLLWQALRRLPDDVRVYPYAYVVARRLATAHAAARAHVVPVAEHDDRGAEQAPTVELDDAIHEAIAGLPPAQRDALGHRVIRGLPRQATASALGITPRQVDLLVSRALDVLRDQVR